MASQLASHLVTKQQAVVSQGLLAFCGVSHVTPSFPSELLTCTAEARLMGRSPL
ncbi:hypothetical protein J3E68DRAFT_415101 [Trichoderma sp. SZMC 28012]